MGSDVVVIVMGAAAMVMLSGLLAVVVPSFTCTVKLAVPATVGVPEIAPVAARFRPCGRLPEVIDQV